MRIFAEQDASRIHTSGLLCNASQEADFFIWTRSADTKLKTLRIDESRKDQLLGHYKKDVCLSLIMAFVLWILIYALGGGGSIGDFFGTLLVAEPVTLMLLLFYWANGDPREAIEAQRVLLGYGKLFFSNDMGFVATGNASELSGAVDALCIRKISRYIVSKNIITVYGIFWSVRNTERGIRNTDEMKAASLDVDSTQSSRYKKIKKNG